MDNISESRFRLPRKNLFGIAAGVAVILAGFVLMMVGPGSGDGTFEPAIFSFRRIVVAPVVIFAGFAVVLAAIFVKFKDASSHSDENPRA